MVRRRHQHAQSGQKRLGDLALLSFPFPRLFEIEERFAQFLRINHGSLQLVRPERQDHHHKVSMAILTADKTALFAQREGAQEGRILQGGP